MGVMGIAVCVCVGTQSVAIVLTQQQKQKICTPFSAQNEIGKNANEDHTRCDRHLFLLLITHAGAIFIYIPHTLLICFILSSVHTNWVLKTNKGIYSFHAFDIDETVIKLDWLVAIKAVAGFFFFFISLFLSIRLYWFDI